MGNRYHLQIETPKANLSQAMQWLNVSYSTWFNRLHRRAGPLFQGRFKAVPLPPLAEQEEVVRQVDRLFSLAGQLETRYARATTYIETLRQSTLAKAFRGELVPQDPTEGSASVLLARIRAERATPLASKSRRKAKPMNARC